MTEFLVLWWDDLEFTTKVMEGRGLPRMLQS